jgi:hypothetical protein
MGLLMIPRRKYGNAKKVTDGIQFDSRAEAIRYQRLKFLQNSGQISNLMLQPVYILQASFKHQGRTIQAIKYIADFQYEANGKLVVEDVKGVQTAEFRLKMKLLLHQYPDIDFRIIS